MSFQNCVLIERESDWWIAVGSETETMSLESSPEELATCVEVMARLAGLKTFHCVIAPASTSCFFVRFDVPRETDLRDGLELTYALEDHLPIDAESMVADFRPLVDRQATTQIVTAVSIPVEPWDSIASAFEQKGIAVQSIVPSALLMVAELANQFVQWETVDYFLVHGRRCDWIRCRRGQVTRWKHIAMDPTALKRLRALEEEQPDTSVIFADVPVNGEPIEQTFSTTEPPRQLNEETWLDATEQLLKRRLNPFDLRRGKLGPPDPMRRVQTPMRFAVLAATVFLVVVAFAGWLRTQRIQTAIEGIQAEQRSLFEDAFPDARVPAALLRRVRSEHTRVMASRGRGGNVDLPTSGHTVLRRLLTALPRDLRFRITKLEVDDGKVTLDLQVRSPVDAGSLAAQLGAQGFMVKPPVTTQSDARTFNSTLEAEWLGEATESGRSRIPTHSIASIGARDASVQNAGHDASPWRAHDRGPDEGGPR